jgi:hypothetical protein
MLLETLTPEQEAHIEVVKNYWLSKLFTNGVKEIKKELIEEKISWMYDLCGYQAPKIVYSKSPEDAQRIAREATGQEGYHEFSSYGNVSDYGWVSFYDYFTQIGVINDENFNNYRQLIDCNVYDMIQFDEMCIVVPLPDFISRDNSLRLHNEDGPAISWGDGTAYYFWKGTAIEKDWIEDPNSISDEMIINTTDVEKRRCIMEIVGADRYYQILGGVVTIDEDDDAYGKPMRLMRSKKKDKAINDYVYYLSVTDTSTDRIYNIYPNIKEFPDAKKNVWAAKASTFRMTKEEFKVISES